MASSMFTTDVEGVSMKVAKSVAEIIKAITKDDRTFSWAKEAGFNSIDMGGDYSDYKKHWAPVDGNKINVNICPPRHHVMKNLKGTLRRMNMRIGQALWVLPIVASQYVPFVIE